MAVNASAHWQRCGGAERERAKSEFSVLECVTEFSGTPGGAWSRLAPDSREWVPITDGVRKAVAEMRVYHEHSGWGWNRIMKWWAMVTRERRKAARAAARRAAVEEEDTGGCKRQCTLAEMWGGGAGARAEPRPRPPRIY